MDEFDLDINNYNIEDILNLFNIQYNFNKKDLNDAKLMAMKTHPDKSKLKKEVFLFFYKAYKILEDIYYFRNKRNQSTEYILDNDIEDNGEKELLSKKINSMNVNQFNKWFNDMFDKVNIKNDNGYGEWFKSNEGVSNIKANNMNEFKKIFDNRKKECASLITINNINDYSKTSGTNLIDDEDNVFSSDIFSKLRYNDLRQAHTETVVPVTNEDYKKVKKYKNVEEYKRARTNIKSMSMEESRNILNNRNNEINRIGTMRAYKLIKQDENISELNKRWWKNMKQLSN